MSSQAIAVTAMPRRRNTIPAGRVFGGLALIALALFFVVEQAAFRAVEAKTIAALLGLLTHTRTVTMSGSYVYYGFGTDNINAFGITTMCSSVILVTPLLVLGGILMLVRSFKAARVLAGLGVALAVSIFCNLVRFVAVGLALRKWGMPGFDIVHHWIGSVFVILGFAASFLLLIWIAAGGKKTEIVRPVAKRVAPEADA